MTLMKQITTTMTLTLGLLLASTPTMAQSLREQWQRGLSGSKLSHYSGSLINSNSTLTVINFCRNGRYSYYREGSWTVPGQAGGASNNRINGRWNIQQQANQIMLVYVTDRGDRGFFPLYLQNNGRVNIGGTPFAIQQGGAGC